MPARGKCWDAGTELWVPGRGWRPLLGSLKSSLCPGDALKEPTVGGRCSACPPTPMGPVLPLSLLVVPLVMVVSVPGTGGSEAEARQSCGPSLSSALR